MRILTTLAMLLASFIPALGATTWPAGTNTANQTFYGNNNFLGALQQGGVAVLTNLPNPLNLTTLNIGTLTVTNPPVLNGSAITNLAASNIVSGGVLPMGTVSSVSATAGLALGTDGSLRMWTNMLNGVSIGGNAATVTTLPASAITNNDTRTINIVGPLQQNGAAVMTNNTFLISGFVTSTSISASSTRYFPPITLMSTTASGNTTPTGLGAFGPINVNPPFTITNLMITYNGGIWATTNIAARIYTNGNYAGFLPIVLGIGTSGTQQNFTNDTTGSILVTSPPGLIWTNQYSIQLSNTSSAGTIISGVNFAWQFQIIK